MSRLLLRNLRHYWRTNAAVVVGVATAVAVLAGALTVGHSVRQSLRALVLQRLGATEVIVASDRFFREDLASALVDQTPGTPLRTAPLIHVAGALAHEDARHTSRTVEAYGVDDRFWRFHGVDRSGPGGRTALVGRATADALGISVGDTLLLRVQVETAIPRESLYGRRDETGRTIRLTCGGILEAADLGEFALRAGQGSVLSIFVPLERLQRDLAQRHRINVVLAAGTSRSASAARVKTALDRAMTLEDAGIVLRPLPAGHGVAVESERILLSDTVARAAADAAAEGRLAATGVFSYLANALRANGREIPYSVITAVDLKGLRATVAAGTGPDSAATPKIWLNEWAGRELGAAAGDTVEVDYYRWLDDGRLATETARFRLAGVVGIGGDIDASLAPSVPGVSDARDMHSWDPPFPMDLGRIRPSDEEYWQLHTATPKAFIALTDGQRLWHTRFGQLSSVRVTWTAEAAGDTPSPSEPSGLEQFARRLRARIGPGAAGLAVVPIRERGLDASEGSTDFGAYFVYFSFFLIAAAVLLAAMFFRLGVEQRVGEIGLLRAVGFAHSDIGRLFLTEAAILAGVGGVVGMAGAVAYGGAMVIGLRTWWIGAIGTPDVVLHVAAADLGIGLVAGVGAALAAVLVTLRGLRHTSARALLAGVLETARTRGRRRRRAEALALIALLAAGALVAGALRDAVPQVPAFFGSGLLLLTALLAFVSAWLRRAPDRPITAPGWFAMVRLAARYATHRPGRSLLCIALIAFASFIIVSVEAFRKDAGPEEGGRTTGSGGFALVGRSVVPVLHDPNTPDGRDALGLDRLPASLIEQVRIVGLRERPGDDASCLNLYAPQEPRVLGIPAALAAESRFSFQARIEGPEEEASHPWLLLDRALPDGAIPAVVDAVTLQYILHRRLGDELVLTGDDGAPVRLQLVGTLRDSILQGALLVAERRFLETFPDREGYQAFLIEAPWAEADVIAGQLEEGLSPWGLAIETSAARLAALHRVENTYLSTFQSLGALGLLLGTVGLVAILLRNVFERRRELALLRAVGYHRSALTAVIAVENALIVCVGLACGSASAAVAIVPALQARDGGPPLAAAGVMAGIVLVGAVVSSLAAATLIRRLPLLASIRSE